MTTQRPTSHLAGVAGGQILVLFVLGLFAMIAMVALVIEGSNLFAQQRIAQNGSDATANAGTIVVAQKLSGATWATQSVVFDAVERAAGDNSLSSWAAEYTDDYGNPIGVPVQDVEAAIPDGARGVHVEGSRVVGTSFARLLGITDLTASAETTVVAGALSGECVEDEDGCALLPVTFPIKMFECDGHGNLLYDDWTWIGPPPEGDLGDPYWPVVGADELPGSVAYPEGNFDNMAILPLCRGSGDSTGAFGWLDLVSGMNLSQEIEGPLDQPVDIPDWFQTQQGDPNSVEDELLAYWHQPVLIPLYNQTCLEDPGDTDLCDVPGTDPVGNNTWYYVHTLAVFYIDRVLVQGSNVAECAAPPGQPVVPITTGGGFLGCLKGWFVNYVTAGPIDPGGEIIEGSTPIGIQLIR